MTDKDRFIMMLIDAAVLFSERQTRGLRQVVELDDESGIIVEFGFDERGTLVAFDTRNAVRGSRP